MIMIKVYNHKTCEVLQRNFDTEEEAYSYEYLLDFLGADYEFWLNGDRLY